MSQNSHPRNSHRRTFLKQLTSAPLSWANRRPLLQMLTGFTGLFTTQKATALFTTTFWKRRQLAGLWAWGNNNRGQIGDNSISQRSIPTKIGSFTTWNKISAGSSHSLAVLSNSTLWAWGDNSSSKLGLGPGYGARVLSPVQVGTLSGWSKFSACNNHSMAVRSDGTLWAWGSNDFGQLGFDTRIPKQIGSQTDWSKISARYRHALALKTNGTLWAGAITPMAN
jgi:alpha-tubulin suppressor-like RCC1 family protein